MERRLFANKHDRKTQVQRTQKTWNRFSVWVLLWMMTLGICTVGTVWAQYADSYGGTGYVGVGGYVPTAMESKYTEWDGRFLPGRGRPLPNDSNQPWTWQAMPTGILFHAYQADNKESRLSGHVPYEFESKEWLWDPTLGGRFALVRYGNKSALYPEGFQIDVEGAVIARMALNHKWDMWGSDYRFGLPFTYRYQNFEYKFGYYHISSHRGDELMLDYYNQTKDESGRGLCYRRNYVRDCLEFGIGYRPDANWRFFTGFDYALNIDEGADRWQFKLGAEYSPILLPGGSGAPFLSLFMHWSQETDYNTNFCIQTGWQWRTLYQHVLRFGGYYMNAYGDQYQFYYQHEKQLGIGLWFDY